jgi:hypothetical protein
MGHNLYLLDFQKTASVASFLLDPSYLEAFLQAYLTFLLACPTFLQGLPAYHHVPAFLRDHLTFLQVRSAYLRGHPAFL